MPGLEEKNDDFLLQNQASTHTFTPKIKEFIQMQPISQDLFNKLLDEEAGEATGYIQTVYRQWCIAHPELV